MDSSTHFQPTSNRNSPSRTGSPERSPNQDLTDLLEMPRAGSPELPSAVSANLSEDQGYVLDDNLDPYLLDSPPLSEQLDWTVSSAPEQVSSPKQQAPLTDALIDPILLELPAVDFSLPITSTDFDFNLDFDPASPALQADLGPSSLSQPNALSTTVPAQIDVDISSYLNPTPVVNSDPLLYPEHATTSDFLFNGQFALQDLGNQSIYPDPEEATSAPGPYGMQPYTQPPAVPHDEPTYPDSPPKAVDESANEPTYPNPPPKAVDESANERTFGPLRGGKRSAKISNFKSERFYQPLPRVPKAWGGPELNGEPRFQYNQYGEIDTDRVFTPEQIYEYLYQNPRAPVLWVQTSPSDSSRRYPSNQSDKCRFINCPVKNRTIHKGFFRVAFDEHTKSKIKLDPYHCAGYVHLFCLEKFLDFPAICKRLKVRPDNRDFPEGKNRMAITRDHSVLYTVVEEFKTDSQSSPGFNYEETLTCKLTAKHLQLEPDTRQYVREKRGGNHLGFHRGDLDKFSAFEKTKQRKNPNKSRAEKRKNRDDDTNEGAPGSRAVKRPRNSTSTGGRKRKNQDREASSEFSDLDLSDDDWEPDQQTSKRPRRS